MRFICTILSVIGILLITAQIFARQPNTLPFLIMDFAIAYTFIYTGALWLPTCKKDSNPYMEIVPEESI